jgi:hypothetical protein
LVARTPLTAYKTVEELIEVTVTMIKVSMLGNPEKLVENCKAVKVFDWIGKFAILGSELV